MPNLSKLRWTIAACVLSLVSLAPPAHGHDPGLSSADLMLKANRLEVHLTFARADLQWVAAPSELESLAAGALEVSFDQARAAPTDVTVSSDDSNAVHWRMSFRRSSQNPLRVQATILSKLARGHRQYLTLRDDHGRVVRERLLDAGAPVFEVSLAELPGSRTIPASFRQFLGLGLRHILTGYDHLLFLLGLLLVGGSLRSVAKIITAFTLAHSITLAAATLSVVQLSSRIVEPLIAVSIVYIGLENIAQRGLTWRWVLTFGFGLIHGFGFASALQEIGIGSGMAAAVPLLSFNLGVELGQMAIAALALPVIWRLRQRPVFAVRYVPACSLMVALAGGYWLIQRTLLQ